MTDSKKGLNPAQVQAPQTAHQAASTVQDEHSTPKAPYQVERVVMALLERGSLTCQEAQKAPIFARYLNSVVASLRGDYDVEFIEPREWENAIGYAGESAYLRRYRLREAGARRGIDLVQHWREKRGAEPLTPEHIAYLLACYRAANDSNGQADGLPPAA